MDSHAELKNLVVKATMQGLFSVFMSEKAGRKPGGICPVRPWWSGGGDLVYLAVRVETLTVVLHTRAEEGCCLLGRVLMLKARWGSSRRW
jgi:hypothetical protein